MAPLNENILSADGATQTNSQKAKAEIAELNAAIAREEKNVSDTYYQIGINYFNINRDNPDAQFAELIAAVKAAEERCGRFREQIEKIKAVVPCPKCGYEIPTGLGMLFCNKCGAPAHTAEPEFEKTTLKCFSCGQTITEGSKFCTGCGKAVDEINKYYANATITPDAMQSKPEEVAEIPVEQNAPCEPEITPLAEIAPEPEVKRCGICGKLINDEMIFCTGCGTKIKA